MQKLNQLACRAHPKLGKCASAHVTKGLRLCGPKSMAKAQTKAQAAAVASRGAQAATAGLSTADTNSDKKARTQLQLVGCFDDTVPTPPAQSFSPRSRRLVLTFDTSREGGQLTDLIAKSPLTATHTGTDRSPPPPTKLMLFLR